MKVLRERRRVCRMIPRRLGAATLTFVAAFTTIGEVAAEQRFAVVYATFMGRQSRPFSLTLYADPTVIQDSNKSASFRGHLIDPMQGAASLARLVVSRDFVKKVEERDGKVWIGDEPIAIGSSVQFPIKLPAGGLWTTRDWRPLEYRTPLVIHSVDDPIPLWVIVPVAALSFCAAVAAYNAVVHSCPLEVSVELGSCSVKCTQE